jgi:hypothetical protein
MIKALRVGSPNFQPAYDKCQDQHGHVMRKEQYNWKEREESKGHQTKGFLAVLSAR